MPSLEEVAAAMYAGMPSKPAAAAVSTPQPPLNVAATPPSPTPAAPAAAMLAPPAETAPEPPPSEPGEAIYGGTAPTRGFVDWEEPASTAADYELIAPRGLLDTSEAGRAAMDRLRDGFAEAGAGQTLAKELFADAVMAQQGAQFKVSMQSAEADLRRQLGSGYEAKIAAARGLIQRVAQRAPEIVPFLERTGLGNDPAFIQKVVAAAGRRGRRG